MAEVYPGLGDWLAQSEEIDLDPALDEVAAKVLANAQSLAAQHVDTGAYAASLHVTVDRSSPSRRDRIVESDDPAAIAIEWGHVAHAADGAGTHVPGQHILARAADAAIGGA